jgi:hypothetical protein
MTINCRLVHVVVYIYVQLSDDRFQLKPTTQNLDRFSDPHCSSYSNFNHVVVSKIKR